MDRADLNPDELLVSLKTQASQRGQKTLDLIHSICSEQQKKGTHDYSVATVGKISQERGGPSEQALRNKGGERYRALLAAWASHTNGTTRKMPAKAQAGVADDVLEMIQDARVRALVGSFLAENRKLRAENTLLKASTNIVIDRRSISPKATQQMEADLEVIEPVLTLLPAEKEALSHAISDELMTQMGWTADSKTGRIKHGTASIFKPGFVNAIKKIITTFP